MGWVRKNQVTYFCCDCAELADDLQPLLEGVPDSTIEQVRGTEEPRKALMDKIHNAAAPEPRRLLIEFTRLMIRIS